MGPTIDDADDLRRAGGESRSWSLPAGGSRWSGRRTRIGCWTTPEVLAWNHRDDYMPYWAYLWPGRSCWPRRWRGRPWPAGTQALEIGCGLGLAGPGGGLGGLRVHFTDYDAAPLQFVARSAAPTGSTRRPSRPAGSTGGSLPEERIPLILGADVTLRATIGPPGRQPDRPATGAERGRAGGGPVSGGDRGLEPALAAAGLAWEAQPIEATTEGGEPCAGRSTASGTAPDSRARGGGPGLSLPREGRSGEVFLQSVVTACGRGGFLDSLPHKGEGDKDPSHNNLRNTYPRRARHGVGSQTGSSGSSLSGRPPVRPEGADDLA